MTDVPDVPLHPSLRQPSAAYRRLLRLLGLLLFLTMAGTLAFIMATALANRDLGSLMLLALSGLVMLPVVALLGGLMWTLDRWQARRLNAANRVLRESPPRAARLIPTGLAGRNGVLVALHPLSGREAAGPFHALIQPTLPWSRPPRREITVELYCQTFEPKGELVALQSGDDALLGKIVELAAYQRQMRWQRIAALGLLALLLVIVILAGRG